MVRVGTVTLVRRRVLRPEMRPSVGLVASDSGSVVCGGSGVAWGQRGRVCWALAASVGRRRESSAAAMGRSLMRNIVCRWVRVAGGGVFGERENAGVPRCARNDGGKGTTARARSCDRKCPILRQKVLAVRGAVVFGGPSAA